MLRILCLILMTSLISCSVSDSSSNKSEVRSESFYSHALGNYWDYNVYYPAEYDSLKKYPVIYLLHGAYGDYTQWNRGEANYGGNAQSILDGVISSGQLPPTIVIMPDGRNSWYTNIQGTSEYAGLYMLNAFENDLFRHVEETYPVTNSRSHRAIMGNSMGGHGAIGIGMRNPEYFGTVAALSPAITRMGIPEEAIDPDVKEWAETDFYYLFGNPFEITKWNAVSYENVYDDFVAKKSTYPVRFYITIGSEDKEALPMCSEYLADKLDGSGIENEYVEVPNKAHTFTFWDSVLGEALAYIGKDFLK